MARSASWFLMSLIWVAFGIAAFIWPHGPNNAVTVATAVVGSIVCNGVSQILRVLESTHAR